MHEDKVTHNTENTTSTEPLLVSRRKLLIQAAFGVSAFSLGGFLTGQTAAQAAGVSDSGFQSNTKISALANKLALSTAVSGKSPDGHVTFTIVQQLRNSFKLVVSDSLSGEQLANVSISKPANVLSYTYKGQNVNYVLLNAKTGPAPKLNATQVNEHFIAGNAQKLPKPDFSLIFNAATQELVVMGGKHGYATCIRKNSKAGNWTAISSDNRTAYVSSSSSNNITVVDTFNQNRNICVLNTTLA